MAAHPPDHHHLGRRGPGRLVGLVLAVPHSRRFITAPVLVRRWPATGSSGCAGKPGCTPAPAGCPLILWTRPTKVGERLTVLCRAGICAEDFEAHIGELRAACYAREARVTRNRRWSQLVTIDIIRRDTLAARHTVTSPLQRLHRASYHLEPGPAIPGPARPPART